MGATNMKSAVWTAWENHVVNDTYPLRRVLGASHHGVVFLTEYRATELAIKLVPVETVRVADRLAEWKAAATITHPHLIQLFDVGRCQLGRREFVFVVMEYAQQTLTQILRKRALAPDEVREMLSHVLDTLAWLHRDDLVHGHLKPSNILAVNDQLKLSSDTIRATGQAPSGVVRTSLYDPPELRDRTISTAGDMWALGMTLVEVLTQRTWAAARGQGETTASLLSNVPEPFQDTARRCLRRAPADRATASELLAQYRPATAAVEPTLKLESTEAQETTQSETAIETADEPADPPNVSLIRLTLGALAAALLLFLGAWAILRS